jgi:anti-sigma B factor antagonist
VDDARRDDPPHIEQIMNINTRRERGAVLVTVTGEVDLLTADRFRAAVAAALQQAGNAPVVIDLTGVQFLGSTGLTALVEVTQAAELGDKPFRIVVDEQRPVVRPIQLSGLDNVLALYHNLDDALGVRE